MSYLEYTVKHVPTGFAKILHLNWPLTILLAAVSGVGFLMLYSVAGGSFTPWAEPQMKRFALGIALMIAGWCRSGFGETLQAWPISGP